MEVVDEKMITDKALSDNADTNLKSNLEESVVVTTTVVETTTEVSTVETVKVDGDFMKNQEEELFGSLVGEDEGLKVDCDENGTSVAMDVDGSLAGDNGSCFKPVSEGEAGDLPVEHDENAGGDPMDIFSFEENEKKSDKWAEILESKEDTNKNDEGSMKIGEDNGKELAEQGEEENHSFVVGDFVWGKVKSHPWWPGQIYDPSDASENATTLKHKGQILVAYFGDKSFSWSSPSELKPFIDNFKEMSSQSDTKKFLNAVQKALEEVSRLVEAELMCKCQSVSIIKKSRVVNRGLKEGARVPQGNTVKVLIDRVEPVELVSTIKAYAMKEPDTGLFDLDLTFLRSCMRAFYTVKSVSLVDNRDPKCMDGIGLSGSPENGDDKLYQKRKQKSVAELLVEDKSKVKKGKTSKDGGMKDRKRKMLVVSVPTESDQENGDGESGGGGGGGVEDETMSPRQRKKSRYLSPPYLSPVGSGRLSVLGSGTGTDSFKEPKTETEKVSEMDAKQPEDTLKKSSRKKTRRVREVSESQEHKKGTDAVVDVQDLLNKLLHAALDPTSFMGNKLPEITEFVSSFRSSIFKEGTCNQPDMMKDKEGEDTSELVFIKNKLEWMSEMVHACEESEMNADLKASLEGGIHQVLEKVVQIQMRGE